MKKVLSAALVAFAATSALAQEAPMSRAQRANPEGAAVPTLAPAETAPANVLSGTLSANDMINKSVTNPANESVGDINDILISKDGKIAAIIVGVGGFLGLGEKDVALPFDQIVAAKDPDGNLKLTTSMTKESLQSAPAYIKPDKRS